MICCNEKYVFTSPPFENFNTEHRFIRVFIQLPTHWNPSRNRNQTGFQMYNGAPIEISIG